MAAQLIVTLLVLVTGAWGHPAVSNVRIYGGHAITIDMAPYMASLRLNGTYHWCGGSIIHEQFVLTSAHCIQPGDKLKVVVGTDIIDEGEQVYDIKEIINHEKYEPESHDYDVCLIKLSKPLVFGPEVGKIALVRSKTKLNEGIMLEATGWGQTEEYNASTNLLQVNVPLLPEEFCQRFYIPFTMNMLCAGSYGHDTCAGDSGGPLTLGNKLVGITSFGDVCGKSPGVYIRVTSINSWIQETIEKHSK